MSETPAIEIDPSSTALLLIDLQTFTVEAPTVPIPGRTVLANAVRLAEACRRAKVPVVLVRVMGRKTLPVPVDAPMPSFQFPPGAMELARELGPEPGDLVVDKHSWGAFHGTDLYLRLRRLGVKTIIVGGIATNFGVESTARQAHDRGYAQVIVADATAAFTAEEHEHPFRSIFPRIAQVRSTDEVVAALGG